MCLLHFLVNCFTTTFVITAKFVITSIWSAQKISGSCTFSLIFPCYSQDNIRFAYLLGSQDNIRFAYLLGSPRRGYSNKYTKGIIDKKCSKVSVINALDGSTSSFFMTLDSI